MMLRYNLSFFADKDEKTEQATPKKRRDARNEGQVAKSQEVSTAFLFFAMFFALRIFAGMMFSNITSAAYYVYTRFGLLAVDDVFIHTYMVSLLVFLFSRALLIVAPLFAVSFTIGIVSNVLQVGWNPTLKPLMPKFNKLNPISGFKRIVSLTALVTLFKSLAKLAIIGLVIFSVMRRDIENIPRLAYMETMQAVAFVGDAITRLGLYVALFFLFIALADYSYTLWKHNRDLRMTKQEVKDEWKNMEGNPQTKNRIRKKMQEASMRRMMQEMPQADVIITNPTHYAVALKYDRESPRAPVVIAKGIDFLANKIKEVAKEHKIEIVENVQLARALYDTVDVGKEIPPELYQAVAEILALVYKMKNKA